VLFLFSPLLMMICVACAPYSVPACISAYLSIIRSIEASWLCLSVWAFWPAAPQVVRRSGRRRNNAHEKLQEVELAVVGGVITAAAIASPGMVQPSSPPPPMAAPVAINGAHIQANAGHAHKFAQFQDAPQAALPPPSEDGSDGKRTDPSPDSDADSEVKSPVITKHGGKLSMKLLKSHDIDDEADDGAPYGEQVEPLPMDELNGDNPMNNELASPVIGGGQRRAIKSALLNESSVASESMSSSNDGAASHIESVTVPRPFGMDMPPPPFPLTAVAALASDGVSHHLHPYDNDDPYGEWSPPPPEHKHNVPITIRHQQQPYDDNATSSSMGDGKEYVSDTGRGGVTVPRPFFPVPPLPLPAQQFSEAAAAPHSIHHSIPPPVPPPFPQHLLSSMAITVSSSTSSAAASVSGAPAISRAGRLPPISSPPYLPQPSPIDNPNLNRTTATIAAASSAPPPPPLPPVSVSVAVEPPQASDRVPPPSFATIAPIEFEDPYG
jgi:hypothetical protein